MEIAGKAFVVTGGHVGVRRDLVDLRVQAHAVVGRDGERGAVQAAELVGAGRPGTSGPDDPAFDHDTGGHRCGGCGRAGREPGPSTRAHASISPFVETCRRTNRPPILVTIS